MLSHPCGDLCRVGETPTGDSRLGKAHVALRTAQVAFASATALVLEAATLVLGAGPAPGYSVLMGQGT